MALQSLDIDVTIEMIDLVLEDARKVLVGRYLQTSSDEVELRFMFGKIYRGARAAALYRLVQLSRQTSRLVPWNQPSEWACMSWAQAFSVPSSALSSE